MSLKIEHLKVNVQEKEIIHDISLELKKGQVIALMGPNGSGKSTLAQTMMGNPTYSISQGKIMLDETDITQLPTHERARKGLFLSFQYPEEIEGVTVMNFLRRAYTARYGNIDVIDFYKLLQEKMELLKIEKVFAKRYINVGFSGGEKKKIEILQLAILNPDYAILDETDSGTDVDALKTIAEGINHIRKTSNMGMMIITHYTNILKYIMPDRVLVMHQGEIIKEDTIELAQKIQDEGFVPLQQKEKTEDNNIKNILKTVYDPELGMDIVTLGLIYDIQEEARSVKITMTFTSPMCPYGPMLVENVKKALYSKKEGLQDVTVEVTFNPPWQPTEEVKTMLGV